MFTAPKKYQLQGEHNNGHFLVPHWKITDYFVFVVASDGEGWEHVSVSLRKVEKKRYVPVERNATWIEMCFIKDLFWEREDAVMQLHPPKSDYVSTHPYCLHLWKPTTTEILLPDSILVGFVGDNIQKINTKTA